MPRNKATQRQITLAMLVLDDAAFKANTERSDTHAVRLALAVLWGIMRDRSALTEFLDKVTNVSPHPWEGAREAWYGIAATLREEGWYAPIEQEWIAVRDAETRG